MNTIRFFSAAYLALAVVYMKPLVASEIPPQAISFNCFSCHSSKADQQNFAMPRINGRNVQQMEKILLDFKYNNRPSTVMRRITLGYSDAELKALADYLSHQQ